MSSTGIERTDELFNKLSVCLREQIASKYREEDEVKWREKLMTIKKDQERFCGVEKYKNRVFSPSDSQGKYSQ